MAAVYQKQPDWRDRIHLLIYARPDERFYHGESTRSSVGRRSSWRQPDRRAHAFRAAHRDLDRARALHRQIATFDAGASALDSVRCGIAGWLPAVAVGDWYAVVLADRDFSRLIGTYRESWISPDNSG